MNTRDVIVDEAMQTLTMFIWAAKKLKGHKKKSNLIALIFPN